MTTPVPVQDFGKDHWSVLAYVESCCVEGSGTGELDRERMRCNPKTHPVLEGHRSSGKWIAQHGTRLAGFFKDGEERDYSRRLDMHDDWDCLEDLESAGLINIVSLVNGFVLLTDKGIQIAARLREWKVRGGAFATFKYEEPVTR